MTRTQRLVLVISILASFVAFLDGSVVNVALPAIQRSLGGGLATQQWVTDAYLITLGSLILLAGSLSDLFGRVRILQIGLGGFAATSLLCALAPSSTFLIVARALQGVAGALLVPSSLALIISSFTGKAQGRAIGQWTGWTGISFIIGPLLGGFLVDAASWRLIFAINLLPIVICVWLLSKLNYPDERTKRVKLDTLGALMCSFGLSATVFGLIEQPAHGWNNLMVAGPLIAGVGLLLGFLVYERRNPDAMLPLSLFRVRNFWAGNLATIAIYGGLSIATFVIVIFLQQVGGYSAFNAGLALLPVTLIMFFCSPRFGMLAGTYGPRLFMTVGPLLASAGFLLMLRVTSTHLSYATQLLPGILVFGIGLSATVAPLTSAVLGDIDSRRAGIASAVNNAVSRISGLITIALVGVIASNGITLSGFHRLLVSTAMLIACGGMISLFSIRNHIAVDKERRTTSPS